MANESAGIYVRINGALVPAATVPGPLGPQGIQGIRGIQGIQGQAAAGIIPSAVPPTNPTTDTLWLDTQGYGTPGSFIRAQRKKRTSGNIAFNSATWANVDTTMDLTINALVGDSIELGFNARVTMATTGYTLFDFVTLDASSAPVNSVLKDGAYTTAAAPSTSGWNWGAVSSAGYDYVGRKKYTIVAGDLINGLVTFRLRAISGSAASILASDPYLYVEATNVTAG